MPAEIAIALVETAAVIESLAKEARNDHHGYDYASAESIIAACRPVLLANGLLIQQASWACRDHPSLGPTLSVVHRLLHAESGVSWRAEPCEVPIHDHAGKGPDKAATTSLTTCYGYFLRGLLCLPRLGTAGAGDDVDAQDRRDYAPPRNSTERRGNDGNDGARRIKVKYAGDCPNCGGRLEVGEEALWKKGYDAKHIECPRTTSDTAGASWDDDDPGHPGYDQDGNPLPF